MSESHEGTKSVDNRIPNWVGIAWTINKPVKNDQTKGNFGNKLWSWKPCKTSKRKFVKKKRKFECLYGKNVQARLKVKRLTKHANN